MAENFEELRAYAKAAFILFGASSRTVMMDLGPYYHTWIQECFPEAIRIADRFHAHRYVIEALHASEKRSKRRFLLERKRI
ncbi:transposase [Paenibacillus sp. UY79]|nr:transposase [Paenibacillus farraposensis]